MIRRLVLVAATTSAVLLATGGVASAHIDPDPVEAQAGSRLTVGFTVEHGCEGSPTVQLDMRLPEGVVDPVTDPVEGWDGSVETVDGDTIVTFAGGPLPDDVEGTFSVTMTLPPTPDETIYFPFVQRCEVGEIRWIQIPNEPGDELDEPAPAMTLTGPVAAAPSPSPTTPATDSEASPPTPTTESATTEPATTEPATSEPATTESSTESEAVPSTSDTVAVSSGVDEGADSRIGTIMFIASIAAVLGIAAFVVFRSRQARGRAPNAD
jgi:uncharacterized protein YcnI